MRTYAHAIPGTERSAADQMEAMFATVPDTLAGWRGQNAGSGEIAEVVDLPEAQP